MYRNMHGLLPIFCVLCFFILHFIYYFFFYSVPLMLPVLFLLLFGSFAVMKEFQNRHINTTIHMKMMSERMDEKQ